MTLYSVIKEMQMALIAHVTFIGDWESARNMGEYEASTRGENPQEAGFVQAVALDGVRRMLDDRYADIRVGLLLVILDTDALTADGLEVSEETPGLPRVHGPIPTDGDAVVTALPIEWADGDFVLPDLDRYTGAGHPTTGS